MFVQHAKLGPSLPHNSFPPSPSPPHTPERPISAMSVPSKAVRRTVSKATRAPVLSAEAAQTLPTLDLPAGISVVLNKESHGEGNDATDVIVPYVLPYPHRAPNRPPPSASRARPAALEHHDEPPAPPEKRAVRTLRVTPMVLRMCMVTHTLDDSVLDVIDNDAGALSLIAVEVSEEEVARLRLCGSPAPRPQYRRLEPEEREALDRARARRGQPIMDRVADAIRATQTHFATDEDARSASSARDRAEDALRARAVLRLQAMDDARLSAYTREREHERKVAMSIAASRACVCPRRLLRTACVCAPDAQCPCVTTHPLTPCPCAGRGRRSTVCLCGDDTPCPCGSVPLPLPCTCSSARLPTPTIIDTQDGGRTRYWVVALVAFAYGSAYAQQGIAMSNVGCAHEEKEKFAAFAALIARLGKADACLNVVVQGKRA